MASIFLLTMVSREEVEEAKPTDAFEMVLWSGHPYADVEKAKAGALADLREYTEEPEAAIDWEPSEEDPAILVGSSEADGRDQSFMIRQFEV